MAAPTPLEIALAANVSEVADTVCAVSADTRLLSADSGAAAALTGDPERDALPTSAEVVASAIGPVSDPAPVTDAVSVDTMSEADAVILLSSIDAEAVSPLGRVVAALVDGELPSVAEAVSAVANGFDVDVARTSIPSVTDASSTTEAMEVDAPIVEAVSITLAALVEPSAVTEPAAMAGVSTTDPFSLPALIEAVDELIAAASDAIPRSVDARTLPPETERAAVSMADAVSTDESGAAGDCVNELTSTTLDVSVDALAPACDE